MNEGQRELIEAVDKALDPILQGSNLNDFYVAVVAKGLYEFQRAFDKREEYVKYLRMSLPAFVDDLESALTGVRNEEEE